MGIDIFGWRWRHSAAPWIYRHISVADMPNVLFGRFLMSGVLQVGARGILPCLGGVALTVRFLNGIKNCPIWNELAMDTYEIRIVRKGIKSPDIYSSSHI